MNKRKIILVIGYDGYIGFPLTMRLLMENNIVYGIDNYSRRKGVEEMGSVSATDISNPYERRELLYKIGNFTHKDIDSVKDDIFLESLIKRMKFDVIINLGHNPSAPYSQIDRHHANNVLLNNIISTNNILWFVKKYCPDCHYLTIGSTGEYNHSLNVDIEEGYFSFEHNKRKSKKCLFPREANSLYHAAKISSTYIIDYLARLWDLKCTDVMQSVVYGIYTPECDKYKEFTRLDTDECFIKGTNIFTPKGQFNIENILVGDNVYTHKGNSKKVKKTIINDYDGDVYNIKLKNNLQFTSTPAHPYYISIRDHKNELNDPIWMSIDDIYKLSNKRKYKHYDCLPDKYIKSKELRDKGYTYSKISELLEIKYTTIVSWLSKGQFPKKIINCDKTYKNDIFFMIPIIKHKGESVFININDYLGYGVVKDGYIYTPNPSNKNKIWGKKHKIKNILDIDKKICLLSGYYLAEGSGNKSIINFSFHKDEIEFHNDVINIFKEKFDKDVSIYEKDNNGVNLTTHSVILRKLFQMLFGNNSYDKHIPVDFFKLSNDHIKELIKGYWRGDGYYSSNGVNYLVGMSSVSKNLLKQIQLLLLRFGILSTVQKREMDQILDFKGRNRYDFHSVSYYITITGEYAREFLSNIADIKNIEYPKRYTYKYKDQNYMYVPIDDISIEQYNGKIYNFEIEDDESYLVPVAAHNCFGTVIHRFIIQSLLNKPLTIYGHGMHQRGFLSLNDSIQALMIAVNNEPEKGKVQTWNQLSEWYSINDLIDIIKKVLPNTKTINIDSPRHEFTGGHYYKYNTDTLKNFGYKPTRTISDEIKYIFQNVDLSNKIKILENAIQPKIIF